MDSRIIEKIKELVVDGVRHVKEMKRHLTIAVQKDICPNEDIPLTNRRYFPSDKDIKNHMDIALNNLRYPFIIFQQTKFEKGDFNHYLCLSI